MDGVYYENYPDDPTRIFAIRRFSRGRETAYVLLAPNGEPVTNRVDLAPPRCWDPSMAGALRPAPATETRV